MQPFSDDPLGWLELELLDRDLYRGINEVRPGERPHIYGGQVAAQALLAASNTVSADRLPHSLHGYFLRPGDLPRPVLFSVDRDRDGRSFSARRVAAIQGGEVIFEIVQGGRGGGLIRFDDPAIHVATSAHLASAGYALLAWFVARSRPTKKPEPAGSGLES